MFCRFVRQHTGDECALADAGEWRADRRMRADDAWNLMARDAGVLV